jgi:hypothetical protein
MPGKKKHPQVPDSAQLDLWSTKQDLPWEDFKVAREYIRSLGLQDYAVWEAFVRDGNLKDCRIPENPDKVYNHMGWKGWDDWLGTEQPEKGQDLTLKQLFSTGGDGLWSDPEPSRWMNFHEARRKVWEYGFEYEQEWRLFAEGKFPSREAMPDNIPANPDRVYRHLGWKGWKDWLVPPAEQVDYTGLDKARDFVRSCRIPDKGAWRDFLTDMAGLLEEYQMVLPVRPHLEYSESGWISWEDWLGSEINYRDFKSTRKFVRSLHLRNQKDWADYCTGRLTRKPRKARSIFSYPEIAYRNEGWKGWDDWLGTGKDGGSDLTPSTSAEITIDCKCKGRLENCPECDGKGYYTVHLD